MGTSHLIRSTGAIINLLPLKQPKSPKVDLTPITPATTSKMSIVTFFISSIFFKGLKDKFIVLSLLVLKKKSTKDSQVLVLPLCIKRMFT